MEQHIAQMLASLQSAVTTLAPEVWAALVFAARLDSVLCLAYAIVTLSGAGYFAMKLPKLWERAVENNFEPPVALAGLFFAVLAIIAVIVLFSTSTWLGLFYPEAAVIQDLMKHK